MTIPRTKAGEPVIATSAAPPDSPMRDPALVAFVRALADVCGLDPGELFHYRCGAGASGLTIVLHGPSYSARCEFVEAGLPFPSGLPAPPDDGTAG